MANSVSSKELPQHVKKAVDDALAKAKIKTPVEISREWDIMGFILREELARENLEKLGEIAQQVATHAAPALRASSGSEAAASAPHPVAGFLPNKRIILGFIHEPQR
jgi:hypothetical protein